MFLRLIPGTYFSILDSRIAHKHLGHFFGCITSDKNNCSDCAAVSFQHD